MAPKLELHDNEIMEKEYLPDFYFFDSYYDTETRLAATGHWAVSKKTADVWEWMLCRKLGPRALRSHQESIRKQIGLSTEQYHRLSKKAPCRKD